MHKDSGIFPRFYTEPTQDNAATAEEGRPIFIDREMVEITIAGDSKSKVVSKVREEHKQRWPELYAAFKSGEDAPVVGTRIEQWGAIPASRCAELKAQKILTVEALAELGDNAIERLGMGGRELVAKANAYIETRKDEAAVEKYAVENEKLKTEVEALKTQVEELASMLEPKDDKPRRGRPPKAA